LSRGQPDRSIRAPSGRPRASDVIARRQKTPQRRDLQLAAIALTAAVIGAFASWKALELHRQPARRGHGAGSP